VAEVEPPVGESSVFSPEEDGYRAVVGPGQEVGRYRPGTHVVALGRSSPGGGAEDVDRVRDRIVRECYGTLSAAGIDPDDSAFSSAIAQAL
jgi:NADPH:quinone reductase-like Zn-dependent oxidoreductase